jgi:HEAT repeat protein
VEEDRVVSHFRLRRRGRSKIERLRDRGDVRRLVGLLGQHDWIVDRDGVLMDLAVGSRIETVYALGTIDDRSAEDGIVRALADDDPRVRRAAVEALAPSPGPRAAKALARTAALWRTPALAPAHQAAVNLLVGLADELNAVEYTQILVETRAGGLSDAEHAAVTRLFAADSGPVAEVFAVELVRRLRVGDEPERRLVDETLIAMGSISVRPLIAALDDHARRCAAAAVLGTIRDARAVPALVDMLSAREPAAQAAAARALGEIRDPRALEALVRASGDPDADVRDAALEALDQMRGVVAALGAATLHGNSRADPAAPPSRQVESGPSVGAGVGSSRSLLRRLLGRQVGS